mmetsp:Transcript_73684/g.159454  ORF Transcript_73684/g.159454 Transcript_73684/m.159454 type:complete len:83 (+) Transcript_73684:816-1064(+)
MLTSEDKVSKKEKSPLEKTQNTTKANATKVPHVLKAWVWTYFKTSALNSVGSLKSSIDTMLAAVLGTARGLPPTGLRHWSAS